MPPATGMAFGDVDVDIRVDIPAATASSRPPGQVVGVERHAVDVVAGHRQADAVTGGVAEPQPRRRSRPTENRGHLVESVLPKATNRQREVDFGGDYRSDRPRER